jgi:putative ABC transport system permease protein
MFNDLLFRLRALFQRTKVESELDEELRAHFEHEIEKYIRAGLPPQEAARRARLAIGGAEQIREECREARGVHLLETTLQDLRFGVRMLRKSPGFTITAVVTLALGIGANTAIFGLVDTAFLRAVPFSQPEGLVHVWTTDESGDTHTPSPEQFRALQRNANSFQQVAGTGWGDFFYGNDSSAWQNLPGLLVTPNWLPTLGIQPILGRNFFDEEQIAGRDAVVILSYACWRNRFHGNPHIIGTKIVVNRRDVAIVGVLPQSLGPYYEEIELFVPLVLDSYAKDGNLRGGIIRVQVTARLKLGVTLEQARAETEVLARQLRGPRAVADQSGRLIVEDFAEMFRHPGPTRQNARRGLWMTAAAAAVVLLIACANVASLLLARGVKRQREVAVRAALGCSRARMIRQLLTESTLLFLCGGAVGVLLARWGEDVIGKAASGLVPGTYLRMDGSVLTISLGISLLCALFFGLAPALQTTRADLNGRLKNEATNAVGSRSRRPRNALVVFQIALGMSLLVGFGLLFRSLLHVESSSLGYDPNNVLTATLRLPPSRYADPPARARLIREVLDRTAAMPGVMSAGATDSLPMDGAESAALKIERALPSSPPIEAEVYFVSVSPEYFSTLRVPVLAGRAFRDLDIRSSSPVLIVNETFAKQYFPGVSPVGYHIALPGSSAIWAEIVGVVSDFRQRNPEEDLRPLAYFPLAQTLPGRWSVAIRLRSSTDFRNAVQSLGNWLRPVDPQLYWQLGTMREEIYNSESLTLRRPLITLLASFGGLSLTLAVIGVFGVTSYSVSERTREIGIRVALGAARSGIAGLVFLETLRVTASAIVLGTLGAYALTRFLPTAGIGWSGSGIFLYGVSRTDAPTYICAAILLTLIALLATWIPARRATRVDPLVALRYE